MTLFDWRRSRDSEEILGSDAATRALSVTVVENDFVAAVYAKISAVYDFTFGPTLHPGRVHAIQRMGIRPGDRVLEVGVGTGINVALYPRDCLVTGIDFSPKMLARARNRIARKDVCNVSLFEMDATSLKFADNSFDVVYAPYVISVVPDPVAVTREMWRERAIAPFTLYLGFKSDLDLPAFLTQADLNPISIERVNFPRIWSLVTCTKD